MNYEFIYTLEVFEHETGKCVCRFETNDMQQSKDIRKSLRQFYQGNGAWYHVVGTNHVNKSSFGEYVKLCSVNQLVRMKQVIRIIRTI